MQRRRPVIALVVAAGVLLGALAGPSAVERLRHPRDVDAYQDYVVTYMLHPGTPEDENWAVEHPDQVLAEGDRACEWLSRRPSAPDLDPTGASSVHHLGNVYLDDRRREGELALTREGHRTLVVGAWAFLCWPVRRDKSAPVSELED
jgi:hypothetical protein